MRCIISHYWFASSIQSVFASVSPVTDSGLPGAGRALSAAQQCATQHSLALYDMVQHSDAIAAEVAALVNCNWHVQQDDVESGVQ